MIPSPKTILEEAQALIYGARQTDYGDAFTFFSRVAAMWSVILDTPVTPEQVCLCMDALKTVRLLNQPTHRDSIIDKAGYAGCYEKVLAGRKLRA
jgi:hypothetical protein